MDSTTNLSCDHGSSTRCAICKVSIKSFFASIAPVNFLSSSKPAEDAYCFATLWLIANTDAFQSFLWSVQLSLDLRNESKPRFCFTWLDSCRSDYSSDHLLTILCIGTHSIIMLINCLMSPRQKKGCKEFSFTSNGWFNVYCIKILSNVLALNHACKLVI